MNRLAYANPAVNRLDRSQLQELQFARVKRQLKYCYNNSDFYRRKFHQAGVNIGDITSLEDYRSLPVLMDKESERESQQESIEKSGHPFGAHLCSDPSELRLAATTSGTTGMPTFSYSLAEQDLETLSQGMGLMLSYGGRLGVGDRVLFAHALGIYATSSLLPSIRANDVLVIDVDVRAGADAIMSAARTTRPRAAMMTPSLAEHLIKRFSDANFDPRDLRLQALYVVGEIGVGIPEVKARIEDAYGCRVYDWTAPMGQTLAFSCDSDEYHGLHAVTPDLDLYPLDLIDPDTRRPIEIQDGSIGEAMYTSLQRRAMPLLRYASGDIIQVFTAECPGCGFAGPRVKVIGRSDDMLIIKGANVYPAAIKQVVAGFAPAVTGEMRIVLDNPPPRVTPPLKLKLEHADSTGSLELEALAEAIRDKLSRTLRVKPEIIWTAPGSLDKSLRKTPVFERNY